MKRTALPLATVLFQMAADWLEHNLSPGPVGRAYRRKRAWENSLDSVVTGATVQGTLQRLQDEVDAATTAEGLVAADRWRVGRHYSKDGETLEARRLIEDPLNGAKLFLFLELEVQYGGNIRGLLHVKTWGERTLSTTDFFAASTKRLPPTTARPWRVRVKFEQALQDAVRTELFAIQTQTACAAIRRAMDNALTP